MKSKNPFKNLLRKRKNMSKRMVALLNDISRGNKTMEDFTEYNDIRTLNALVNRCLLNTQQWMKGIIELSYFSDDDIEKHAHSWEVTHKEH